MDKKRMVILLGRDGSKQVFYMTDREYFAWCRMRDKAEREAEAQSEDEEPRQLTHTLSWPLGNGKSAFLQYPLDVSDEEYEAVVSGAKRTLEMDAELRARKRAAEKDDGEETDSTIH